MILRTSNSRRIGGGAMPSSSTSPHPVGASTGGSFCTGGVRGSALRAGLEPLVAFFSGVPAFAARPLGIRVGVGLFTDAALGCMMAVEAHGKNEGHTQRQKE